MLISILVPTCARPAQLAEALASVARQDHSLIGEIVVGDDSPREFRGRNQAAIATSGLADLVEYLPSEPPRGVYPNHWFLAEQARCDHLLYLHDDDMLCPDALRALADLCENETNPRVKLWFGNTQLTDEQGRVDPVRTAARDRDYGRTGGPRAQPMWQWCLTESIPPNAFLIERDAYLQTMRGPRDGNVGDWAASVRLANKGAWARFTDRQISLYRVHAESVTNAGRGVDVHLSYEAFKLLEVPPEAIGQKRLKTAHMAPVATTRYARDGERLHAWQCYLSNDWGWRQRLSVRGLKVLLALSTPKLFWNWALRYR